MKHHFISLRNKANQRALLVTLLVVSMFYLFPANASAFGDFNSPISAGSSASLAVNESGTLYLFGNPEKSGGDDERYLTPTIVLDNVVSVSASSQSAPRRFGAVTADGTLYVWGFQHGFYTDTGKWIDEGYYESPIAIMRNVIGVSIMGSQLLALKADNTLYGLGYVYGTQSKPILEPTIIANNVTFARAGYQYNVFIKNNNLYGFGLNVTGRINNSGTDFTEPFLMAEDVIDACPSNGQTYFVTRNGELYVVGSNYYGEFGLGHTDEMPSPHLIMDNVVTVAADKYGAMAIKRDNTLWIWGMNYYGTLGNGTMGQKDRLKTSEYSGRKKNIITPTQILSDVHYISMGSMHSIAVTGDGSLYTWGYNRDGELGNGRQTITMASHNEVIEEDHNYYTPTIVLSSIRSLSNDLSRLAYLYYESNVSTQIADINNHVSYLSAGIVGECVWYVNGRMGELGYEIRIQGNGGTWWKHAQDAGMSTGQKIASKSIACFSGITSYGHVIFVEHVDGDTVFYTEANVEPPISDGKISPLDGVLKKETIGAFEKLQGGTLQGYIYLQD